MRQISARSPSTPRAKGRFEMELWTGRGLYDAVIEDGILAAKRSVWIATANVKELYVERRGLGRGVSSIVAVFDELAGRGVELRLLHADLPSKPFRAAFDRRQRLVAGALERRHCPRVHLKTVIIDGSRMYLGSANLTGAGLGIRGDDKRNFELGFVTEDFELLDRVQALYQELWDGAPCSSCQLRSICPDPGPKLVAVNKSKTSR